MEDTSFLNAYSPLWRQVKGFWRQTFLDSPIIKQMTASAAGSIIAVLALNPISVIKVNLQNSANKTTIGEVISTVQSTKGLFGFWGGARIGLVQALPSTVIYMSCYERAKQEFQTVPFGTGLAGGIARFIAVSVISPIELIRTIQTGGSKLSAATLVSNIYQTEGIAGLYRGWLSSILRDVPFSALYWFSFETISPRYKSLYSNVYTNASAGMPSPESLSHIITFAAGATSGMVAALVTHPFDVVKTQQQLARHVTRPLGGGSILVGVVSGRHNLASGTTHIHKRGVSVCDGSCNKTTTIADVVKSAQKCMFPAMSSDLSSQSPVQANHGSSSTVPSIVVARNQCQPVNRSRITVMGLYRAEGIEALFRGLSMRLATVIPASAIMVTVYKAVNDTVVEDSN